MKKLFPKNVHEEGDKNQFGIFMGEALSDLFNLEFVSEKVSFFQMQVSLALLHVADKFIIIINDFKTKWNGSFEWFQIQKEFTTLFEEMSPQPLVKCLQKFILHNIVWARKHDSRFINCVPKL